MPPINPQASRGGLITTVVVMTILFLTAFVFAITFNAKLNKSEKDLADLKQKYSDVAPDVMLTDPAVEAVRREAAGAPVLQVVMKQRDDLGKLITGKSGTSFAAAQQAATSALDGAARQVGAGVTVPRDGLTSAVSALAGQVATENTTIAGLRKDLKAANDKVAQTVADREAQIAAVNKQMEGVRGEQTASVSKWSQDVANLQGTLTQIQTSTDTERKTAADAVTKKDAEIAAKQKEIERLNATVAGLTDKMNKLRQPTENAAVRQPKAVISRVIGNNLVYINRGEGEQITPGMTFEVYDRGTGIPPLGDATTNENLPVGKASIEVLRVGATSSECRVIKSQPGTAISEGDLCQNLIYDPNTKSNFLVYGNFDLDQNGVPTPQDAEVIKRLITQWGGKVANDINVDTDFVVLGVEPKVPTYSQEDLKDPINRKKYDDALAAVEAFNNVKAKAVELHIPVLNQNRFLYYIGYYEMARR